MTLLSLSSSLIKKLQSGDTLKSTDWPADITFSSDITKNLKSIEKYTNKEGMFAKKSGSAGWEYAITTFYFIDEIYLTPPVSGNYSSVSSNHSISFKPIYNDNNTKLKFELSIDNRVKSTKQYDASSLSSNIEYGFVATFHTHPKFYHDSSTFQYTFYSNQDLNSLVYGRIPIHGLIVGNKLWLACKTQDSQIIPNNLLGEASRIELQHGNDEVLKFVKEYLRDFGIVFYYGSVGGRVRRV